MQIHYKIEQTDKLLTHSLMFTNIYQTNQRIHVISLPTPPPPPLHPRPSLFPHRPITCAPPRAYPQLSSSLQSSPQVYPSIFLLPTCLSPRFLRPCGPGPCGRPWALAGPPGPLRPGPWLAPQSPCGRGPCGPQFPC